MPTYKNKSNVKTYGKYDFVLKPNEVKEGYIYLEENNDIEIIDEKPYYSPIIYDNIIEKVDLTQTYIDEENTEYRYYIFEIPYNIFDECYIKISPIFVNYDDIKSIYKSLKIKVNGLDTTSLSFYDDFVIDRYIPMIKRIYILLNSDYYDKIDFIINISVIDNRFIKKK